MLVLFEGELAVRDTVRFIEDKLKAGLWTWDVDSNQMDWSPGMYKLLGLDPETVPPSIEVLRQMILSDDRPNAGETERLIKRGLNFDRRYRIVRPDGRIRTLESRGEVLKTSDTDSHLAIGVISDVTDISVAMEVKEATEERLGALLVALGGLVWVMRPDGAIAEYRGSLAGDYSSKLGHAWHSLLHPDDLPGVRESIAKAARENTGYRIEYRRLAADGSYRWVRGTAAPLRDANLELREFVGISLDIEAERVLPETSGKDEQTITGAQIRAARGLVKWSVQDLSESSGVSVAIIRRCEATDGFCITGRQEELALKEALMRAGARFYFHPGGKPSVAPR